MNERSHPPASGIGRLGPADALPGAEFLEEPFPCPACGQLLAPSCRVCVACKQPIDPAQIRRPRAAEATVEPRAAAPPSVRARFSWTIFILVLLIWALLAVASQTLLGPAKSQLVLGSGVLLSSAWVFFDAHEKRVPKPLRWGVGSLLLWIVVFPWYLARRRTPRAPCPFVEAEGGPLARALLFALLLFFLLSVVLLILKGPPPR